MSGRCSATLAATPLAGSGERAFSHWLDSEQWASELKAAVPRLGARGAVLPRSPRAPVIQSLGFGWIPAAPAGTGRGGGGGGRVPVRAPAAVLLKASDAEDQSAAKLPAQPPSPVPVLPPPPSRGGVREEEEGRGRAGARPARGREGGGGEGERWAALAPGGVPRGSRARVRCAPPTTLSQWKWTRVHLGPRPSWVPAASRTHAVPAVRGRLLSGPRALAGNSGDDRVSSSGAVPGASRH